MPKNTFLQLDKAKKQKITDALLEEFSEKPFKDVTVASIIKKLEIPRGSFYQYFEDLEDSYFYILDSYTHDIHTLYIEIAKQEKDVFVVLEKFGDELVKILFDKNHYNIYRNKYLYWSEDLEARWNKSHKLQTVFPETTSKNTELNAELLFFIRSIIHDLIKRNFQEKWTSSTFLEKYNIHITWIKKGVL